MIKVAIVLSVVDFLATDLTSKQPKFANTVFSGDELCCAVGLKLPPQTQNELMNTMASIHYIQPLNKFGPNGRYYNVTPHVFCTAHPVIKNKWFVNKQKEPENGWCITYTANRVFRLTCKGQDCKFFSELEKKCVQNKCFFPASKIPPSFK